MIRENSPLLRMPTALIPQQLVLFDGIRHAAEISWLAFRRLDVNLTWLADATADDPERTDMMTAAYLDAWSLVDAVDRFRSLWKIIPRPDGAVPPPGTVTFQDISSDVRMVRNVTDHLATRIDYVVAKGTPTMGALTWVTFESTERTRFKTCAMTAGTARTGNWEMVNPVGQELVIGPSGRTAQIHIAAGEYRANLSKLIPEMEKRIKSLERDLEATFQNHNVGELQAGTDYLIVMEGMIEPVGK